MPQITSISSDKNEIGLVVDGITKLSGDTNVNQFSTVPHEPDNSVSKPLSPTLLEHAFKVVKNLFSPDKSKSMNLIFQLDFLYYGNHIIIIIRSFTLKIS